MKKLYFLINSIMLMGMVTISTISLADPLVEKGLKLAKEMDDATAGYKDYKATATMHLINRQGKESLREMKFRTLEVPNDGDKSMVVFEQPLDIKGFSALTYAHKKGSDDQWMYLPRLHRVKRISSINQAGPFVGSEFAYEDIGSQEVEQYTYKYKGIAQYKGAKVELLERYPVDKNSGYSRQVVSIDSKRKIPLRIEYYDRKNKRLKVLMYNNYRLYEKRFWKPDQKAMINQQTGKKTVVDYRDYVFHTGLNDRDFSVSALKRLR